MRVDKFMANGTDPSCGKSVSTSFDFCQLNYNSTWVDGKKYKEMQAQWLLVHDSLSAVGVQICLKGSGRSFFIENTVRSGKYQLKWHL